MVLIPLNIYKPQLPLYYKTVASTSTLLQRTAQAFLSHLPQGYAIPIQRHLVNMQRFSVILGLCRLQSHSPRVSAHTLPTVHTFLFPSPTCSSCTIFPCSSLLSVNWHLWGNIFLHALQANNFNYFEASSTIWCPTIALFLIHVVGARPTSFQFRACSPQLSRNLYFDLQDLS